MTFRRLGGTRDLTVSLRVIAATNKELAEEVRAGRLPAGPLPPPRRVPHPRPAAARPARGHPPAGRALPGHLRHAHAQAGGALVARDREAPARLRLPRQRARAPEPHRARGDPLVARGDRARLHRALADRPAAGCARHGRRPSFFCADLDRAGGRPTSRSSSGRTSRACWSSRVGTGPRWPACSACRTRRWRRRSGTTALNLAPDG